MHKAPTQAELLRFVEGDLPASRSREIERSLQTDEKLANEVAAIRADLQLAQELRAAAQSGIGAATERRIAETLTASVTEHIASDHR